MQVRVLSLRVNVVTCHITKSKNKTLCGLWLGKLDLRTDIVVGQKASYKATCLKCIKAFKP